MPFVAISQKLHATIRAYVTRLEQHADRSWYPPLIAFLSALDNLVIVIPNDGILIASSMLIPKRWPIFAIFMAIGSTLGAVALSAIVEQQGLPWILEIYPDLNQGEVWQWTEKFFNQYGMLLVFGLAASPLMQQPIVIIAALSETPLSKLAAVIFAGRLLKFIVIAYIASHSPRLLKKLWGIKDEMEDAGVKID